LDVENLVENPIVGHCWPLILKTRQNGDSAKKTPWFSSRQVTDHEYVVLGFIGRVKLQRVESCKSVSQSMDDS